MNIKRICINCGSSLGVSKEYTEVASLLGEYLAKNQIELVYGGASVGLMGVVADSVLRGGGKVTGVITESLAQKVKHDNLSELIIVNTMHERKMKMFELSDAFIALPGGIGTLEEVFELLTWAQLDIHSKPVGMLNVAGYFNKLLEFLDYTVSQCFVKEVHRNMLLVDDTPEKLIEKFHEYRVPAVKKWFRECSTR